MSTHKVPTAHGIIVHTLDNAELANSCLDFAYDTFAILRQGVDEKDWKRVEAALVMLDYLCQQRLDVLICDMRDAANAARILEEVIILKPDLHERRN